MTPKKESKKKGKINGTILVKKGKRPSQTRITDPKFNVEQQQKKKESRHKKFLTYLDKISTRNTDKKGQQKYLNRITGKNIKVQKVLAEPFNKKKSIIQSMADKELNRIALKKNKELHPNQEKGTPKGIIPLKGTFRMIKKFLANIHLPEIANMVKSRKTNSVKIMLSKASKTLKKIREERLMAAKVAKAVVLHLSSEELSILNETAKHRSEKKARKEAHKTASILTKEQRMKMKENYLLLIEKRNNAIIKMREKQAAARTPEAKEERRMRHQMRLEKYQAKKNSQLKIAA